MSEEFTNDEKKLLSPFVSNMDKDIFVLKNLPEVVKGALFSRYSRSAKSLRRVLLEEFILQPEVGLTKIEDTPQDRTDDMVAKRKAEEFYDRVLVGYGDDSVAELAGAHIALENISIVATKIIEDARIGLSPLEKSTRYVYFDKKRNGKWLYLEEKTLCKSEFADEYRKTCDMLFETYATMIPKVSEYIEKKTPREEGVSDRAYTASLRAKTCDILRGLLPASTLTNMGFFGNGRAYEYLLTKMLADGLMEINELAGSMQTELMTVIPSFVKRATNEYGVQMQNYIKGIHADMDSMGRKVSDEYGSDDVVLVEYDQNAEEKVIAAAMYPHCNATMKTLIEQAKLMGSDERKIIIDSYLGKRKNRRHKPGRAFEMPQYTFDICTNFGAYRDLHRHRVLTQQRQLLGCMHGYTLPKEIIDAGLERDFRNAMDRAKDAWKKIVKKYPKEAQYVVPLAYKIRWQITMNLREAGHFCELRSMRQGHIDYRIIAQKISEEIKKVHPSLSKMEFVDTNEYALERLEAEKQTDRKIKEITSMYGK